MKAANDIRELIHNILEKLLTSYAPRKVILFGSYAHADPRPGGDLDLLIIKETSERFIDRWVTVRRLLSDPNRTIPARNPRVHTSGSLNSPAETSSWQQRKGVVCRM